MLTETGFEIRDVTTAAFRLRFADGSALFRHHFVRLGFLPGWKAIAPEATVERVVAELERRLNVLAGERGELTFSVPIACLEARPRRDP